MGDTSIDIENILKENQIYRFSCELQYSHDDERKEKIRKILRSYQNEVLDKEKLLRARSGLDKFRDEIVKNQYKKKWHRLTKEQKKDKLDEYYYNMYDKTDEKKEIYELLENDKLKNSNVNYSESEGKINEIILVKKQIKNKKKDNVKSAQNSDDSD